MVGRKVLTVSRNWQGGLAKDAAGDMMSKSEHNHAIVATKTCEVAKLLKLPTLPCIACLLHNSQIMRKICTEALQVMKLS